MVARRRPQTTETRYEDLIINTLIKATSSGKAEITILNISQKLTQISRHADLTNPEEITNYIATSKRQDGQPTTPSTKNKLAFAYNCFCQANNIEWKRPYYKYEPKMPIIPTTDNVTKIISASTEKYATIFTILAETGIEGHELEITNRKDIDAEQGILSIKGCKGHLSGTYKLRPQTAEMLRRYLAKYQQEYPFPNSKAMGETWRQTRKRTATNLCQPQLNNIPMKNLRNYSGAQLYYKIPDPIAVMRHLRHKKLETTMHYIRGMTLGEAEDFTCKTATNVKQATELIETGFQYVTTIEGVQLFRKRK